MGNGACSNLEQYLKGLKAALALGEAVPHKRSRALAGARTTTVQAQVHTKNPPQPVLFQHCSPLGCWKAGKHTLRGEKPTQLKPQGFCSTSLGLTPTPNRVVLATEQKRSLISHLALA